MSPSLPSTRFLHAMSGSQPHPAFFQWEENTRRWHPNRQVAHHCRNEVPLHRKKRTRPLMRACSSFGYEPFGHLGGLQNRPGELADYPGGLRDRPGGIAPYPSGFPPAGSGASSGEASGANRESEYTMLSGRKGLSSSESPLEAAPALSTGKRRMARRLSS